MQAIVPASSAAAPRMDSMSLPDDARYGADAVLLKSSRVASRFFPQNAGTFGPATSRVIRFDISSPDFLDLSEARLQGSLSVTESGSGSSTLDGGLGGMIQRISIMNASGQLLERIDDYNLLQTVLLQCSERARDHEDELWLEEAFLAGVAEIPAVNATVANRIGNGTSAVSRDLSHRMHGSWFQTHKKKLLPPGVAFKVEIELVSSASEAVCNSADITTTLTFSNVFMSIPSVQIMSQAFDDNTSRLLSRGWSWTGSTYRRYTFSVGASGGDQTINVPDKSLSLTGVIAIARDTTDLNGAQKLQNYTRNGSGFNGTSGENEFNLQIGSQQYPANKVTYAAVANTETASGAYKVAQAVEQIEAVLGYAPRDCQKTFGAAQNNSTAGTTDLGLGFLAVQCGFPQGQGIDTQSASLPVLLNCGVPAVAGGTTLTVYCQSTAMFRMEPGAGMMSVVSYI